MHRSGWADAQSLARALGRAPRADRLRRNTPRRPDRLRRRLLPRPLGLPKPLEKPTSSSQEKADSTTRRCRQAARRGRTRAAPTPVIAVVGRNDLKSQTTPFIEIYAVADYSDTDTAPTPYAPQNYCTTSEPTSGPATPHRAESAPIAHTPIEAANFRRVPVVPANLQAVCCRLDHQPSLPAAAVRPCRDLTAAVGIPARRGVMTGFVASQYVRSASVRRNYLR